MWGSQLSPASEPWPSGSSGRSASNAPCCSGSGTFPPLLGSYGKPVWTRRAAAGLDEKRVRRSFHKKPENEHIFLKTLPIVNFKFHKLVLVNIHPCRQLKQVVNQSADHIGSFRKPYSGRVSDFYANSILYENEGQLGTAMCHQVLCETWKNCFRSVV